MMNDIELLILKIKLLVALALLFSHTVLESIKDGFENLLLLDNVTQYFFIDTVWKFNCIVPLESAVLNLVHYFLDQNENVAFFFVFYFVWIL